MRSTFGAAKLRHRAWNQCYHLPKSFLKRPYSTSHLKLQSRSCFHCEEKFQFYIALSYSSVIFASVIHFGKHVLIFPWGPISFSLLVPEVWVRLTQFIPTFLRSRDGHMTHAWPIGAQNAQKSNYWDLFLICLLIQEVTWLEHILLEILGERCSLLKISNFLN
jgi:hypothetical protein